MKRIYLVMAFFQCFSRAFSQEPERIDTDRPDQTESVFTVPKKYFQAEFGFGKENFGEMNYHLTHPGFLLKYGLTKKMELRLEGNFISEYIHVIPETKSTVFLEPVEIGTKIALLEEKGLRPKTSLILHLGLPFTGTEFDGGQNFFPSFRFAFQNSLSQQAGLGYNLGAGWDGYDRKPVWLYTLSPNCNIGKRWYAYIELFGFIKTGELPQHALDGGLAFYTSSNTKLDFSGGIGLGPNPLRNYLALGFSFRMPTGKP
jgi:hypothetical protein